MSDVVNKMIYLPQNSESMYGPLALGQQFFFFNYELLDIKNETTNKSFKKF